MEVKEMNIKIFMVSRLVEYKSITTRHITLLNKNKSLCGTIVKDEFVASISLKMYSNLYKNNIYNSYLCMECFNELPKNIQDRIKFNYIVAKLKS